MEQERPTEEQQLARTAKNQVATLDIFGCSKSPSLSHDWTASALKFVSTACACGKAHVAEVCVGNCATCSMRSDIAAVGQWISWALNADVRAKTLWIAAERLQIK